MRNILLTTLLVLFVFSNVKSQETKKIGSSYVTLNNQHPDKFIIEDDDVKITFDNYAAFRIDFSLYNKSDKAIDIIWTDCYFVIDGQTDRVDNAGVSKTEIGLFATAVVDNMKSQKIGSKSSLSVKMASSKFIFGDIAARKHYRETGETLVNRAVIALTVDGVKKEYPITIELYTKKELKERKSQK